MSYLILFFHGNLAARLGRFKTDFVGEWYWCFTASKHFMFCTNHCKTVDDQGQVVQSILSKTRSLRGHLAE